MILGKQVIEEEICRAVGRIFQYSWQKWWPFGSRWYQWRWQEVLWLWINFVSSPPTHHRACGILVPWPQIETMAPALEAQSLNPWTAREVLSGYVLKAGTPEFLGSLKRRQERNRVGWFLTCAWMHAKLLESCLTLWTLWIVACQAFLSTEILLARMLKCVASSRGSSQPRNWTCISYVFCIDSGF